MYHKFKTHDDCSTFEKILYSLALEKIRLYGLRIHCVRSYTTMCMRVRVRVSARYVKLLF